MESRILLDLLKLDIFYAHKKIIWVLQSFGTKYGAKNVHINASCIALLFMANLPSSSHVWNIYEREIYRTFKPSMHEIYLCSF